MCTAKWIFIISASTIMIVTLVILFHEPVFDETVAIYSIRSMNNGKTLIESIYESKGKCEFESKSSQFYDKLESMYSNSIYIVTIKNDEKLPVTTHWDHSKFFKYTNEANYKYLLFGENLFISKYEIYNGNNAEVVVTNVESHVNVTIFLKFKTSSNDNGNNKFLNATEFQRIRDNILYRTRSNAMFYNYLDNQIGTDHKNPNSYIYTTFLKPIYTETVLERALKMNNQKSVRNNNIIITPPHGQETELTSIFDHKIKNDNCIIFVKFVKLYNL